MDKSVIVTLTVGNIKVSIPTAVFANRKAFDRYLVFLKSLIKFSESLTNL